MKDTAKLGLFLPAVLNPATAAVGIGLGLLWLLRNDEEETVEPVRIKRLPPPVRTAVKPLPTIELSGTGNEVVANEAVPTSTTDADRKEIIRTAMSELGKRSAAARAKKNADREGQGL